MAESKTNEAWNKIFYELDLHTHFISNNFFNISAKEIKKISNREPRLMSKFDDLESRPNVFKKIGISILPVKNGEYLLIKGDAYCPIKNNIKNIKYIDVDKFSLETLPLIPRSESQVIDMAFASKILHEFLDEEHLVLTIRGRLRTKPFNFYFSNNHLQKLHLDGVQVEVDAGYEGKKIYLIEAKMGERKNFITRQLYYPFRMWHEENVSKEVVPVFINYFNKTLTISKYRFDDFWNYSSIQLDDEITVAFEDNPISFSIKDLLNNIIPNKMESELVPFPQANDITKVRDTIDLVSWGHSSKEKIAEFWGIDTRQSDYYCNAGMYLNFMKKEQNIWGLTDKGKRFVDLPTTKRNFLFCTAILESPVFYEVFYNLKYKQTPLSKDETCQLLQSKTNKILAESTLKRRAQTINAWIKYFISM